MANSYYALHFHIIFSVKKRERVLVPDIEHDVWAFIGGIATNNAMTPLCIGGTADHIHILLGLPATLPVSKAIQHIKGGSSKWLSNRHRKLHFPGWQDGYGAFTVSQSHLNDTITYIRGQREHHKRISFEEEYRKFLNFHGIEFDDQYLLDD
jgi:REP element-mobilizing transposase RayT